MQENKSILTIMLRLAKDFNFTSEECCVFFDLPYPTWNRIKNGKYRGKLTSDQRCRVIIGMSLYESLIKNRYNKHWLMNTGSMPQIEGSPFENIKKSGLFFFAQMLLVLEHESKNKSNL
jgi:hypothetical protein